MKRVKKIAAVARGRAQERRRITREIDVMLELETTVHVFTDVTKTLRAVLRRVSL